MDDFWGGTPHIEYDTEPVEVIGLREWVGPDAEHGGHGVGPIEVLGRADGKPHGIVALFDQGVWWSNIDHGWVLISSIDSRYATNIRNFLERLAYQYHARYCWALCRVPGPNGDMASLDWARELDDIFDLDPEPWLGETKLYKAICARIAPAVDVPSAIAMPRPTHG